MNVLEIFKPGTHTTLDGTALTFRESDLRATAVAYSPELHEAPLVIGHPTTDGPAYGWVKKLAFAEGALLAEPHQTDVSFANLVNAGRYKKISASFYLPNAPNNPHPGVYYLRHVGFLGAAAPAIKGLKQAEFADSKAGVIEFSDILSLRSEHLGEQLATFEGHTVDPDRLALHTKALDYQERNPGTDYFKAVLKVE